MYIHHTSIHCIYIYTHQETCTDIHICIHVYIYIYIDIVYILYIDIHHDS